jgi:hypothetical protein
MKIVPKKDTTEPPIIKPYPENERFEEFYLRVRERLGDPEDNRCTGDQKDMIAVLTEMGADVPGSLAEIAKVGHFCCACELMMNFPPEDVDHASLVEKSS